MSEDKKPKKKKKKQGDVFLTIVLMLQSVYFAMRHTIFITFIQSIRRAQMSIMRLPRWR